MMKGKRNEGKERKKNKKEKKREETNKGKNYNKIWYWRGEKRYISPQSGQYLLWGKNIILGGGENMILGEINTPGQRLMNISPTKSEFLFTPSLPLAASAPASGFF